MTKDNKQVCPLTRDAQSYFLLWMNKEKLRDEMKKIIQRGFCTGGFCLNGESRGLPRTGWLPVLGQ